MARRHPKRSLTRDVRTRRPLHPGRLADELEAVTWPASLKVQDRMTRGPATIRSDALVRGAISMMSTRKLRHLPVLDGDGHLVGIVTDRDLRQVLFSPALRARLDDADGVFATARVRDVMTWAVVTARSEMPLVEAARLMYERKIGALPVVDRGRLVGIITESDILKAFQEVLMEGRPARPYRWAFAWR
jgi:acetoin utilization protein AcuB